MGTTTFSGPIKAGTIKDTTGTTLGTNIKNTGQVVMSQTFSADLSNVAIGTTAGRKYPTTQSGGALAWEDVGTADIRLTVTNSAATSAGEVRVTILYAQNNNLA